MNMYQLKIGARDSAGGYTCIASLNPQDRCKGQML